VRRNVSNFKFSPELTASPTDAVKELLLQIVAGND